RFVASGTEDPHPAAVDDDRCPRAEPARLGQLPLLRAAGVVRVARETSRAQPRHRREYLRAVRAFLDDEEAVDLLERELALAGREQQALHACAESDARRGRTADRLHQAVVTATAADRALCTDRLVAELECGSRVVVEPADEGRLEFVAHAVRFEVPADRVKVTTA